MPKKKRQSSGQIVLFPGAESVRALDLPSSPKKPQRGPSREPDREKDSIIYQVVVSGSFRKDIEGLRRAHEELRDLGCIVLSPTTVDPAKESSGFVFMKGEEKESPEHIETKHLEAIQKSAFVWLHAPEGYVGLSAALEVGFAHAQGIPVFCLTEVIDITLRNFVQQVESIAAALDIVGRQKHPIPRPNILAFQNYYKQVARHRGYERESAQNCLLLMVEEVGELARAIRKREDIVRHGTPSHASEAQELADVFLYVIHMANILGLDLGTAVREKEELNIQKFVSSR